MPGAHCAMASGSTALTLAALWLSQCYCCWGAAGKVRARQTQLLFPADAWKYQSVTSEKFPFPGILLLFGWYCYQKKIVPEKCNGTRNILGTVTLWYKHTNTSLSVAIQVILSVTFNEEEIFFDRLVLEKLFAGSCGWVRTFQSFKWK